LKMWGGRFEGETDPRAADYGRSIEFDRALAADDLRGSMAHVHGLAGAGVLTQDEAEALVSGLEALLVDLETGAVEWDPSLEDVHLNLEAALERKIGPLAGKLHTGRSRNDQVATDLRLWLRRAIDRLDGAIADLELALVELAERNPGAILAGTTHLQPAQPVLLAHHLLAYVEMLERDRGRLSDCRRRSNVSPLGSGAIAGAGFRIDREAVARELGFDSASPNSIDAVSDRDFVAEFLAAAALAMVHLSRLAEEITWWSNPAFGFVRVGESFATGSSMMPNKRNPDPAELVRARSAGVIGHLMATLTLLKGLPLAYQRDLQETVPRMIEGATTLQASLDVLAGLVRTLEIDRDRMAALAAAGYTTATAVSDALVERGVSFRAAHAIVGSVVKELERDSRRLDEADDGLWARQLAASPDQTAKKLAEDRDLPAELRRCAGIESALARPDVVGGTAPARVAIALAEARRRLESTSAVAEGQDRSASA
jgi:argininosuccinate lyase